MKTQLMKMQVDAIKANKSVRRANRNVTLTR